MTIETDGQDGVHDGVVDCFKCKCSRPKGNPMETDELSVLDPNVDFRQVPPIHQKRTIAFVNHFVMRTVSFLNNFAETCETRLMEFDSKIQNIEASLLILESQLSSVPWLDKIEQTPEPKPEHVEKPVLPDVDPRETNEPKRTKAIDDPRYSRFFKMLQFGVPLAAVKLKMESEGFDPAVLDSPNGAIPETDSEVEKL